MKKIGLAFGAGIALASSAIAQNGDRDGHVMKPPPAEWVIPPAPVMTAKKAVAGFKVPEGFKVELVAAEPDIHDPVALCYDGNGRIWVAEMTGYMPNVDGTDEHIPNGRIIVLEDTDGDGLADRSAVFADKLILPRAVSLADADRTLIYAEDNELRAVEIIESNDGGLPKAGETTVIDPEYANGANPEHSENGFVYAIDNWYYSAKSSTRYRSTGKGQWTKEKTESRGQWGISQDDDGRLFTNTNSNLISAEQLHPGVTTRNPNHQFSFTSAVRMKDQSLFPSRISPGVNRGYMEGTLDKDGYLRKPTATCGAVVYRGDQFPEQFYGDLFIPEPSGNLVKRAKIQEDEFGNLTVIQVPDRAEDELDFFTSTDERNRIVNAYTAPDGSLHLVDFYRGILQHRVYLTTFLRHQIEERGLDKPVGLGRIWRVSWEDAKPSTGPKMLTESSVELVAHLSHKNGWWRDTAQRLIVQRGDQSVVPALEDLVRTSDDARSVSHALWALEGLGSLSNDVISAAASHSSPKVVACAIRIASEIPTEKNYEALQGALSNPSPLVQRQLASALGLFREQSSSLDDLASVIEKNTTDKAIIDLAMSGLHDAEFDFLSVHPQTKAAPALVSAIVKGGKSNQLYDLIAGDTLDGATSLKLAHLIARASFVHQNKSLTKKLLAMADQSGDLRDAVVSGMLAGKKSLGKKFKPMALGKIEVPEVVTANKDLAKLFDYSGVKAVSFIKTDAEKAQFKMGQQHYQLVCMACHQSEGTGLAFIAPPLANSEWVNGSSERLVALVMDGLTGPITVAGKEYKPPHIQPLMPGLRINPQIDDEKLAAILTYIRNSWGNSAPPVKTDQVAEYRKQEARLPWTVAELEKQKWAK